MNDGSHYEILSTEMAVVDEIAAHVLYRDSDGKYRTRILALVCMSSVPHPCRVPTLCVSWEGNTFHCVNGKRWNGSAESKNLIMRRNFSRENREIPEISASASNHAMVEPSENAFVGTLHLSALSEQLALVCLSLVRPLKPDDPERITDSSRWLSVSDTTGSDDVHCPPTLKGSKILRPLQGRRVVSFVPGVRCSAATPGYYL